MPYVLNQKLDSSPYEDAVGHLYHVPKKSLRLARIAQLASDQHFVYYQPRENGMGACYFGTGIIAHIEEDAIDPSCLWLRLEQYTDFRRTIPFKDEHGIYIETGSTKPPVFQWPIRSITDHVFERVVLLGAGQPTGR